MTQSEPEIVQMSFRDFERACQDGTLPDFTGKKVTLVLGDKSMELTAAEIAQIEEARTVPVVVVPEKLELRPHQVSVLQRAHGLVAAFAGAGIEMPTMRFNTTYSPGTKGESSRGIPVKDGPTQKFGRNLPCKCGSGKKYKHCCLRKPKGKKDGKTD